MFLPFPRIVGALFISVLRTAVSAVRSILYAKFGYLQVRVKFILVHIENLNIFFNDLSIFLHILLKNHRRMVQALSACLEERC